MNILSSVNYTHDYWVQSGMPQTLNEIDIGQCIEFYATIDSAYFSSVSLTVPRLMYEMNAMFYVNIN